jgi:hypothetical protein
VASEKLEPLTRAGNVVRAWDGALNRRDAEALAGLYAESVSYYGQTLKREKVIASKKKALAATPDFAQSLSNLNLASESDGSVSATFTKRSGPAKAQRDVPARLKLREVGGKFLIALESDEPSDANSDDERDCLGVALAVAHELPQVKRLFNEAPADAGFGGVTFPDEPGYAGASIGFHHEDHFESVFVVEVKNGELSVMQYGEPLALSSAARARVRAKCTDRGAAP